MGGLNQINYFNQNQILLWIIMTVLILVGGYGLAANPVLAQDGAQDGTTTGAQVRPTPISIPATPVPETIAFSQNSQVTRQSIRLRMNSLTGGTIRYTTNGGLPLANSSPYTAPLTINRSTVVRAQAFKDDGTPLGNPYTKSYLVASYPQTIPVISLVTDWGHFNTLHTNPIERGKAWERPVNIEYFDPNGQVQFNVRAGFRIHGNLSREYGIKKSYRLYFRKEYGGPGNLEYPLFKDSPVTKFDKLVLRAIFQDSLHYRNVPEHLDLHETAKYISDQAIRNLHQSMGQPIVHGDWVLLYLNGEFWGLYNLTERVDLQFLRSYSDKEADWNIIGKEAGFDEQGQYFNLDTAKQGDLGAWIDNQNWIGSADFSNSGNIGVLEWRVDIENLFSYAFLQAYVQNTEFPAANWIVYRRQDPGAIGNEGKWRLLVWDSESSFGSGANGQIDINTVERVHSPHDSITRMLEKPFIKSCGFKHRFVDRAREYLGVENKYNRPENEIGQLSKERVRAEIIKQAAIVRPFIQMETDRWAPDLPGPAIFEKNIASALKFAAEREEIILHHLDILRYQTFTECQ